MRRVKEWAAGGAPRWYCLVVGIFLGVRAVTTLLAGASFATPGDGWRAVLQLASVAVLAGGLIAGIAGGLVRRRAERVAVAVVGTIYLASTALELVHGADLLGLIPVDTRDRFVHPLLALAAVACLLLTRTRPATQPGLPGYPAVGR